MPAMTMIPFFEVGESGIPGDYRAFFFPTLAGTYSFHFTGSIKNQQVDETFTSGPSTFSDVVDPSSVEFPAKDPTAGELAQRAQRDSTRIDQAKAEALAAADRASSAHTLAVVGVAVGALGLLVGIAVGASAVRARRSVARSPRG